MNQRRQTILVIFCISGSVALMIPNVANVFTKLNPQVAFETVARINEELKRTEFEWCILEKKINHLIDRFSSFFFAKRRKSAEEMIPQKKNRSHRTSKIVKSRQSYSNGHLPCHCSFFLLSARSMHDVACEFACAVRMHRNN